MTSLHVICSLGPPNQNPGYAYMLSFAKKLKETETEKRIRFFVTFLSLVAFQLGGGAGPGKTANSDTMVILVVYHVYHINDLSQRRWANAHGSILITII